MVGSTLDPSQTRPKRPNVAGALAVGAVLVAGFLAIYTSGDFVPTPQGNMLALEFAIVAAVAFVTVRFLRALSSPRAQLEPTTGNPTPVSRLVGLTILTFALAFEGVDRGALEIWTVTHGHSGQLTMHVAGYDQPKSGRRGLTLIEAPFAFGPAVCTQDYNYRTTPPRGTPIVLDGKVSAFGIKISDFRVVDPPKPGES